MYLLINLRYIIDKKVKNKIQNYEHKLTLQTGTNFHGKKFIH